MQKNFATAMIAVLLFLGASFASAGDPQGESPREALKAIVELYKAQDWEGLVRLRCLDTKHAGSEEAVEELIGNLSSQFSDEQFLAALVSSYEAALQSEPQMKAEGTVAVFSSEIGSVKLSRMDNGAWGLRF